MEADYLAMSHACDQARAPLQSSWLAARLSGTKAIVTKAIVTQTCVTTVFSRPRMIWNTFDSKVRTIPFFV